MIAPATEPLALEVPAQSLALTTSNAALSHLQSCITPDPATDTAPPPHPLGAPRRDANEEVVGHLLLQGYMSLDFGITAYATNTYLQASSSRLGALQQGGQTVVVRLSCGSQQVCGLLRVPLCPWAVLSLILQAGN